MSAERATGFVLRVRPLTESSLIVHWLTAEAGRLATVARGARRPKSPFRGKLDLFYEAEFSFQRRRRSDLHLLCEVMLRNPHPVLRTDLARLRGASYATQLVESLTETETPIPAICALFGELLRALTAPDPPVKVLLAFELGLLRQSGLEPNLAGSRLAPAVVSLGRRLLGAPRLADAATAIAPASAWRALRHYLQGCWTAHLGNVPRLRAKALALPTDPVSGAPELEETPESRAGDGSP